MIKYLVLLCVLLLTACGGSDKKKTPPISFSEINPIGYVITEDEDFSRSFSISRAGSVSVNQLPDWLIFETIDPQTFKLSGFPTEVESDYRLNDIIFTVHEDGNSYSSPIYQYSVKAVDDLPVIGTEHLNLVYNHSNKYHFSLDITDEDTVINKDNITLSFNSPNWELVSLDDELNVVIKTDINLSGDPVNGIDITVNVQELVEAMLHVDFYSNEALTLSHNFKGNIEVGTELIITSNFTLTESNFDSMFQGDCSGVINISKDNFTTCESISLKNISSVSTEDRIITLDDTSGLIPHTDYQLKLHSGLSAYMGKSLTNDETSNFKLTTGVMISEVAAAKFVDDMQWFEIYNGTAETINLINYAFYSQGVNPTLCSNSSCSFHIQKFPLSDKNVAPNEYAIIRGQSWYKDLIDTHEINYIKNNNGYFPSWTTEGFIELVKNINDEHVDMVVFGEKSQYIILPASTPLSAWSHTNGNRQATTNDAYYASIERTPSMTDSNTASDWVISSFNSPLGKQPVACFEDTINLDTDDDGIPDCYEVQGSELNGISLYDFGARVNQKDIFIEVDYMGTEEGQIADEGIKPRKEALQKVVDIFLQQQIAVHFDVGDLYDNNAGINPLNFDLGGGNEVDFHKGISFQVPENDARIDFHNIKFANQSFARRPFFHYMLMANSQQADGAAGSSGLAELNSNDLIITLGNWNLNSQTPEATNALINFQASTIMHELGHNLGLLHGGNDDTNYKPNHFSIMNYLYQLDGLPLKGNNDADRYYHYRNSYYSNTLCPTTAMNNPFSGSYIDFIIDYSHGKSASIFESSVNETLGFKLENQQQVDFNCDGSFATLSVDVNFDGTIGVLKDYNEWNMLQLNFKENRDGAISGTHDPSSLENSSPHIHTDVYRDNNARVINEKTPPLKLIDQLKRL